MTKLVSFFVFILAFVWTWQLFHTESKINTEVHAGIQSKLSLLIEDAIRRAKPNAFNFQILNMYTKTVDDNKVSAFFSYRFLERLEGKENALQTVKGTAMLNRTPSEDPAEQKWIIQSVKTDNSAIEFQEGSVIGSGSIKAGGDNKDTATDETAKTVETKPEDTTQKTEEPKKTE